MSKDVSAALWAIADRNAGRLTPDMVVEAARSEASPLHRYFTWDLKEAAAERWITQARELIRSVRVEITTTQYPVSAPAFVRDPSAGVLQGYASLDRLRSDEDLAREAVMAEFTRASAALERARIVATALGLSNEIEDVRQRVMQLSERTVQASA